MQEINLIQIDENLIQQFSGEINPTTGEVQVTVTEPTTEVVWKRDSCNEFNHYMQNYYGTQHLSWLQRAVERFLEIKIGQSIGLILEHRDLVKAMSSIAEKLEKLSERSINLLVQRDRDHPLYSFDIALWSGYIRTLAARKDVFSKLESYEDVDNIMQSKSKLKKFVSKHPSVTVVMGGITLALIAGGGASYFFKQTGYRIVCYAIGGDLIGMCITHFCIKGCVNEWTKQVEILANLEGIILGNARYIADIKKDEDWIKQVDKNIKLNETEIDQLFLEAQSATESTIFDKVHARIEQHIIAKRLPIDSISNDNSLLDMALLIPHSQKKRKMVVTLVKHGASSSKAKDISVILELCNDYIQHVDDGDSLLKEKISILQNLNTLNLTKQETVSPRKNNDRFFNKANTNILSLDIVTLHDKCKVELMNRKDHLTLCIKSNRGDSQEEYYWASEITDFIEKSYSSFEKKMYLKKVDIVNSNRIHIYYLLKPYEIDFCNFLSENNITVPPSNIMEIK